MQLEVPAGLKMADEERIVRDVAEKARRRLARAERTADRDLLAQARELARRYVPAAAPRLRTVSWSDRQEHRWGSCSPDTGAIRLSHRLSDFPTYVLESVLVHELVHLVEANHSARFHTLADAYPRVERARGFLEAIDRRLGDGDSDWDSGID